MRTKACFTFSLMFITGVLLIFSSCKKDDNDPTQQDIFFNGTTYWECHVTELDPDTTSYLYLFSIVQTGQTLSGEIVVRDSAMLEQGTINGIIKQDSIIFNAAFGDSTFNFTFRGVRDQLSNNTDLTGSLQAPLLAPGGVEQEQVFITPTLNFKCPDVFPNNPYIFRKVNSSSHPDDSAVIFIHGMTGDLTHWNDVVNLLTPSFKEKHDVYLFQYNWKDSIMINGRILLDSITAAGITNPIIVAHSMGGLVARAYISAGGNIARLVALGTPHLGTPLANLTNVICFIGFPGPRDMAPQAGFIQKLLTNTNDIQSRNRYVVFGGQMKGGFKIVNHRLRWVWAENYYDLVDKLGFDAFVLFHSPPNDGLVPLSSGLFEGYPVLERKPVLEWVDHKNLRNPAIADEVMDYINQL